MTQRLKAQFKGSINPGADSLKDNQNRQAFKQAYQEKKREDPNKHNQK